MSRFDRCAWPLGGLILAAALLPSPADAQLYRWVDAEGNVHFSDQPRRGSDEVEIEPHRVQSVVETPRSNPAAPRAEVTPGASPSKSEDRLPDALRRRLERAREAAPATAPPSATRDRAAEGAEALRKRQEAEALGELERSAREKRAIRAERNQKNKRRQLGY